MLLDSLGERGFKKSTIDPYLFIREDFIIVTYIDDCLIFYKTKGNSNTVDRIIRGWF